MILAFEDLHSRGKGRHDHDRPMAEAAIPPATEAGPGPRPDPGHAAGRLRRPGVGRGRDQAGLLGGRQRRAQRDGPDPDADPVGYAQAQILPLEQLHVSADDDRQGDQRARQRLQQLRRRPEHAASDGGANGDQDGSTRSARGPPHEARRARRPAAIVGWCSPARRAGGLRRAARQRGTLHDHPLQRPARADHRALVAGFEKATGITVNVRSDDEDILADEIVTEGAALAGRRDLHREHPGLEFLQGKGLLRQGGRVDAGAHPGQVRLAPGRLGRVSARVSVLIYNPTLITASQLPTSVAQLADPQVQGQAGDRAAGDRLPADRHRGRARLRQGRRRCAG